MGRRQKLTFLQIRHADGQQAHEKMHSIANYQRGANQTYNEALLWWLSDNEATWQYTGSISGPGRYHIAQSN